MPVMMNALNSEFWSNTTTAAIFAAAHLNLVRLPVIQFLAGEYFGYLTQRNEWTLRESIFIHAWYDTLLFTADYLYNSKNDPAHASLRLPNLLVTF